MIRWHEWPTTFRAAAFTAGCAVALIVTAVLVVGLAVAAGMQAARGLG